MSNGDATVGKYGKGRFEPTPTGLQLTELKSLVPRQVKAKNQAKALRAGKSPAPSKAPSLNGEDDGDD